MNNKTFKRLMSLMLSLIIFLLTGVCLLQIISSFFIFNIEKACAIENYNMQLYSPNGPSESIGEIQEALSKEFSSSWSNRLVSGNTDITTSVLLIFVLIVCFSASLYVLIPFFKRFKRIIEKNKQA